jgi:hypothetical protein
MSTVFRYAVIAASMSAASSFFFFEAKIRNIRDTAELFTLSGPFGIVLAASR